jgi:TolB protein
VRAVTTHKARDAAPTWMRDGHALLFVSERSGTRELWKVDLAGGELTQLTDGETCGYPAVSPRGDMVAWTGPERGLRMMQLSTGNIVKSTSPAEVNYFPSWSPDSRYLAVTGRDWGSVDIYLVSADGNRSLLLTKNAVPGADIMIDALPSWSPDGNSMALISNKDGTRALWVLDGLDAYKKRLDSHTPMITFELEDD